jgi:hypothetical protein
MFNFLKPKKYETRADLIAYLREIKAYSKKGPALDKKACLISQNTMTLNLFR